MEVEGLWEEVKRFENPHKYYVDMSKKLWEIKNDMLEKFQNGVINGNKDSQN